MNKTQKFLGFIRSDLGFFLILFVAIISCFYLLSPKISAQLFTFKRQVTLNEFINNSKANGINPQEYWKFREFYSPGYFTFSRDGIEESLLKTTKEKIGIKFNEKNIDLTFLIFSSPQVDSLDMLTKQTDLNSIVTEMHLLQENIIFINKDTLIYKEDPKTIKIVFLLNNAEMKKANGFFKYEENDKKITGEKNWLNITSIKTD